MRRLGKQCPDGVWPLLDIGRRDDGAKGDRTPDLLAASQTLSQLSYGPVSSAR